MSAGKAAVIKSEVNVLRRRPFTPAHQSGQPSRNHVAELLEALPVGKNLLRLHTEPVHALGRKHLEACADKGRVVHRESVDGQRLLTVREVLPAGEKA